MDSRIISIFQEPFSKGTNKKKKREAKKLREAVINFHKENSLERYPKGNSITLQLKLKVNENNPPQLHSISKNILDLLHKPNGDSDDQLNFLLFEDDGQIEVLEVDYLIENSELKKNAELVIVEAKNKLQEEIDKSFGINSSILIDPKIESQIPKIWVISDTMKSFLKSIKLLSKEENSVYESQKNNEFISSLLDEVNKDQIDNGALFMLQSHILKNNDLTINELDGLFYNTDIYWSKIKADITDGRVGINLPGLPIKGNKEVFKNSIEESLIELVSKQEFLSPLLLPISLTIIFIPPMNQNEQNKGKDLDNIVREYFIPGINRHINPPSSYLEDRGDISYGKFKEYGQLSRSLLPDGYPKTTVARYQIFCIPNTGKTSDDGGLIVLFGDLHGDSVLDKIKTEG